MTSGGDGAYVDAGFCCDYTNSCDYVDDILNNTDNKTKCNAITNQEDCIDNGNDTFAGTGGATFRQCYWDGNTCQPNWSSEGCQMDSRCCLNVNATDGRAQCGKRTTDNAHKGTQCNPGCRLIKRGETPDGCKASAAVDLCISTDRTTSPDTKYQGGKFPKQFLSNVCKL